jgi:hypothetical protein
MSTAHRELMSPVASPSFRLGLSLKERAVTDFVNGSIKEEYHVLYEVYDRTGFFEAFVYSYHAHTRENVIIL